MYKEKEEFLKVEKSAMLSWWISRGIGSAIFIAVLIGAWSLAQNFSIFTEIDFLKVKNLEGIVKIVGMVLIGFNILTAIVYPLIEYRQWGYKMEEDKVEIRKGIFFLSTAVIPIIRIQHIAMSQGPIFRWLGLCKVEIYVATSVFEISGIKKATAEEIVKSLKDKLYTRLEEEGISWKKEDSLDQQEEV